MTTTKKKTRILFNCSTNVVGGGLKNSAIFIRYALNNKDFEWEYTISKPVADLLTKLKIPLDKMHVFETSPARSIKERKRIRDLAEQLNVDLVYSMAGPVYVKFKKPHIMGISNPYYTHADLQGYFIGRNLKQKVLLILQHIYILFFIRKANYFIFQTKESMKGFCMRYLVNKKRTRVISNAIGNEFIEHFKNKKTDTIDVSKTIQIFCPAAAYPHKAIHKVPEIAYELNKEANSTYTFLFKISIDKNSNYCKVIEYMTQKLGVAHLIENIGAFSYSESLKLHEAADLLFVPSILETFSASYLEAMAAKIPLIVANKNFAKDICGEGAIYSNPFNAKKTAQKIHNLISDPDQQLKIINEGQKVLKRFGNQENRFNNVLGYIKELGF
jgi:glycosyltransferase involved in cell wall biosynthesis